MTGRPPAGAVLPLNELIKHREALAKLVLVMPDKTELHYLGLREFGPVKPQWTPNADGSLTRTADNTVFKPNRDTGFFESATGEVLQPGFKAFIGVGNYARMLFDAEFRGPFLSIFTWTVVFSALGVREGLEVLAGHGLNYVNVIPIVGVVEIVELNIGHSIVARASLVGMDRAVRDMVALLRR